jgi:2-polyprenyl-3-methyl-5-hydroxy-6-metoxy-1,4-benzoquinol methylase
VTNQAWNSQQYSEHARFVSDLGMPVVALLAPLRGERILDLGCGDGPLTKQLLDLGCKVVGVDASSEMIDAAKALGLDARVMDGQTLQFDGEFDAVFSNVALHWMKQPEKAGDVCAALRGSLAASRPVRVFSRSGRVVSSQSVRRRRKLARRLYAIAFLGDKATIGRLTRRRSRSRYDLKPARRRASIRRERLSIRAFPCP